MTMPLKSSDRHFIPKFKWLMADIPKLFRLVVFVPDKRSRDFEVVVVRRIINLGTGNLEWGGNGKGLRKGRTVYE
jgi:hypothetical protein